MNRTQKRIIGWALLCLGVLMVLGAIINSFRMIRPISELLASPLFYLGLLLGIAGIVVLMGDEQTKAGVGKALKGSRRWLGWTILLAGGVVTIWAIVQALPTLGYAHKPGEFPMEQVTYYFGRLFSRLPFYAGLISVVGGLLIKGKSKK